MKYAILTRGPGSFYVLKEFNDEPLCQLAEFLCTEINGNMSYDFFTGWLKDEYNQDSAYGDGYGLTVYNDKVLVHLQTHIAAVEPEDEACIKFITTKTQMLTIINNWVKFVFAYKDTGMPKEVLLTQNVDGQVTIKIAEDKQKVQPYTNSERPIC